ncbi:MAG: hypothetical protein HY435_01480 [Candidatus Liptonbacteria bacterium]|nr:hypothetical protein [Candidatus Liptonbacteria bacterium]
MIHHPTINLGVGVHVRRDRNRAFFIEKCPRAERAGLVGFADLSLCPLGEFRKQGLECVKLTEAFLPMHVPLAVSVRVHGKDFPRCGLSVADIEIIPHRPDP